MVKEFHHYFRDYWRVARLNPWFFSVNLFSAIAYKTFAIIQPFVASLIIEALTKNNADSAYHYVIVFFLVYLAYRSFYYLNWRAYSWNVNHSYTRLHDRVFNKLINVDSDFTRKIKKGEFMNTINGDVMSVSEMNKELSEFISTILQIIAVLVITCFYSFFFTLLIIISLLVYIYIRNRADQKMNYYWYKTRREDDRYSSFISQIASGLQEVKTFNMLPKLRQKLDKIENRYNKYYKAERDQVTIRDNDVNFFYYMFQVLLYLLLMVFFANGQIAINVLILIISYHEKVITYASDYIDAANAIRLTNASVKRVQKILNYKPSEKYEFGHTSIEQLSGKIEFKKVSLKLDKKSILSNISLEIQPHETIAIVGLPGAGKTMLFNLLLRLRHPTKGEILLDDIDINDFTKEIYTSSVAVANQAPFIFNTSIRNNLDFVNPDIKAQIKACKIAGIHDFIETLPQGYNTILRENASNISVGQKQMISIARTILTDAEILLFDDVTSSLDPKTTAKFPKLINKLRENRTIIMITKNPDLMALADRIVVLNQGKIEAIGNSKSLFDESKTFRILQFYSSERTTQDA